MGKHRRSRKHGQRRPAGPGDRRSACSRPLSRHRASATATRAALRRARHQLWDDPKVLDDPAVVELIQAIVPAKRLAKPRRDSRIAKTIRAFLVARARIADDLFAASVAHGTRQYCIMGAGLDTAAYRCSTDDVSIFEADRVASQEWKREALARAGLTPRARMVPLDLTSHGVWKPLIDAGWDSERPTFFSFLGVFSYLDAATVEAMLKRVAGLAPSTEVVFDVPIQTERLTLSERVVRKLVRTKLWLQGEPHKLHLSASALEYLLTSTRLEYRFITATDINRLLFAGRTDGLRVSPRFLMVHAWVTPR